MTSAAPAPIAPTTTALERATFGSGCFWCTEALFARVRGVVTVTSGYAGGKVAHPTYAQVCTGRTGHAEVVQIDFDPTIVSYLQLVEIFFLTHNPTTKNRQGNDVGPQYRSVIFTHSASQASTATAVRARLGAEHVFGQAIVTDIEAAPAFYPAEEYHQRYYAKNPAKAYCQLVIDPKVAKLRQRFATLLTPRP